MFNAFRDVAASIDGVSLDIIFLAARYTAVLGADFLVRLKSLEAGNAQYGFLFGDHPLHDRFQQLVAAYRICLSPPPDRLQQLAADERQLLARLQALAVSPAPPPKSRPASAHAIDWSTFTVVETVDLLPSDDDNNDAADKSTVDSSNDAVSDSSGEDMDIDSSSDDDRQPASDYAQLVGDARVVRNYAPAYVRKRAHPDSAAPCPVCAQLVPLADFDEHLRIELSDPAARQKLADWEARQPTARVRMASDEEFGRALAGEPSPVVRPPTALPSRPATERQLARQLHTNAVTAAEQLRADFFRLDTQPVVSSKTAPQPPPSKYPRTSTPSSRSSNNSSSSSSSSSSPSSSSSSSQLSKS